MFSACKKNRGSEKQRYPEPLPSSFLDIGESLSAYLQADKNILRIKKIVNVFFIKLLPGWIKKDKKNAALRQHFNVEIIGFEPTTL